jgi:acetylornithine/succinyldiaminopimelate/putrescine aminotransferase
MRYTRFVTTLSACGFFLGFSGPWLHRSVLRDVATGFKIFHGGIGILGGAAIERINPCAAVLEEGDHCCCYGGIETGWFVEIAWLMVVVD